MSVTQIFYVSSQTRSTDEKDIDNILITAREYNSKNDITGILLSHAGIFLQFLEGDKNKVEALYQKIVKDPRHSNVILMFNIDINERIYKDWSMGFRNIQDLDIKMVNEILSWNKLISGAKNIDNKLILLILERFKLVASNSNP